MKTRNLLYTACLAAAFGTYACQQHTQTAAKPTDWNDYNVGTILFEDKAPESAGSDIYHRIIPDAESYIKEQARTVLATLYASPEDSIAPVHNIHYTLEDTTASPPREAVTVT